ncbi:uncharacterized protein LOC116604176 [Nematostella vectensis]|uniref:uncharacterized protein LOC116604176 n=1 Tax=Nematostella vectensis TaxID=45351 RepID=UPI00139068DA|nr:uncharacterized protein LOC116604176 [Nematostella vectensis]
MGITKDEAYRILELPRDASVEEVRASYKRLALKWHPDKHNNSTTATQKFQEVSSAYKRLTTEDAGDEIYLSAADMFDLFTHIFFQRHAMYGFCNGRHHYESDDDSYYSDDNYEDDDEDDLLHTMASKLTSKHDRSSKPNTTHIYGKPAHNLTEAEAMKNAEELIKEEERDRKKAEKRRQKKKRNKEKKKQKDKVKPDNSEKENKQDNIIDSSGSTSKTHLKDTENTSQNSQNNPHPSTHAAKATGGIKENKSNKTTASIKNVPTTNGPSKTSRSTDGEESAGSTHTKKPAKDDTDSSADEPDWDLTSAFVSRAAGRNPTSTTTVPETLQDVSSKAPSSTLASSSDTTSYNITSGVSGTEQMDPLVLQSRQIAVRGNEMANLGNYQAAIELFTQAIKLDARDFRFFGNRSYCFDRLGQFEKALQDADVAISLAPDWPKGFFRRGRALAGLKLFSDAEGAFAHVLKLDKHCEDAMFELARVRVQQLEDMGFPTNQSEAAIQSYGTVQAGLEALLAGKVNCPSPDEIYVSDGEDMPHKIASSTRPHQNIDSTIPAQTHCKSVWVGNVNSDQVTEAQLQQLFSRCGQIETIKILPKKFCAFINYYNPESAAKAIQNYQGYELGGQRFLLRFPNNNPAAATTPIVKPPVERPKLCGPVNGNECYFWRTTGCAFGNKCRNRHVPEHRGCDIKKVEAKFSTKK